LANAVAIPVFGVVLVPGTLIATVLVPLAPALAMELFRLLQQVFEFLLRILEWLAAINPEFTVAQLPLTAGVGAVRAGGLLLAPWLAVPWLLPLFAFNRASPPHAPFEMHVLDVGQGLAVVVETRTRTLVYDTGPVFNDNSPVETAVIPFLRSRGRRADGIMI